MIRRFITKVQIYNSDGFVAPSAHPFNYPFTDINNHLESSTYPTTKKTFAIWHMDGGYTPEDISLIIILISILNILSKQVDLLKAVPTSTMCLPLGHAVC